MEVPLRQLDLDRLGEHARDAGCASVEQFVTLHLQALAEALTTAELPPLPPEQLVESARLCDQSLAELDAGNGRDALAAIADMGLARGFRLQT